MSQKPSVKKWTVRILATTIAAGAVLAAVTLPASAATRRVSGTGPSQAAANDAAERICANNFGGWLLAEGWESESNGRSYTVTATCEYRG